MEEIYPTWSPRSGSSRSVHSPRRCACSTCPRNITSRTGSATFASHLLVWGRKHPTTSHVPARIAPTSCTCPTAHARAKADAFDAAVSEGVETWARRRREALVIERVGGAALRVYAAHRRRTLEGVARDAARVQEAALLHLVRSACGTEFGRGHGFDGVRSVADYQARTPLGDYLRFQPLWNRVLEGERDVTWPGRPRYWVKTSGTTAGDKLIPVTPEAFSAHRKGGWDALLVAAERSDSDRLLGGPLLFLGGSTGLAPIGRDSWVGDLSGLVVPRPAARRPGTVLTRARDRVHSRLGPAYRRGREPRRGPGPQARVRDAPRGS